MTLRESAEYRSFKCLGWNIYKLTPCHLLVLCLSSALPRGTSAKCTLPSSYSRASIHFMDFDIKWITSTITHQAYNNHSLAAKVSVRGANKNENSSPFSGSVHICHGMLTSLDLSARSDSGIFFSGIMHLKEMLSGSRHSGGTNGRNGGR